MSTYLIGKASIDNQVYCRKNKHMISHNSIQSKNNKLLNSKLKKYLNKSSLEQQSCSSILLVVKLKQCGISIYSSSLTISY